MKKYYYSMAIKTSINLENKSPGPDYNVPSKVVESSGKTFGLRLK